MDIRVPIIGAQNQPPQVLSVQVQQADGSRAALPIVAIGLITDNALAQIIAAVVPAVVQAVREAIVDTCPVVEDGPGMP